MKNIVDLIIFCVYQDEFEGYKNSAEFGFLVSSDVFAGREVLRFDLPISSENSKTLTASTYVIKCGEDIDEATRLASYYISKFKPKFIALSGACIGNKGKVKKGDIIFGKSVWNEGKPKYLPEIDHILKEYDIKVFEIISELYDLAENFRDQFLFDNIQNLKQQFPELESLKEMFNDGSHNYDVDLKIGDIATIGTISTDQTVFNRLKYFKRNTIAFDSVGYGIAKAANEFFVPFIIVKSVYELDEPALSNDGLVLQNSICKDFSLYASRVFLLEYFKKFLAKFLNNRKSIIEQYSNLLSEEEKHTSKPYEQIVIELEKKVIVDFQNSSFFNHGLQNFNKEALENLSRAHLLPKSIDKRVGNFDFNSISELAFIGLTNQSKISELKTVGKIKVCCSSIYPAAIAVLKSIKERYLEDLIIDVKEYNSIDIIINSLNKNDEYDFVIAADDPFFIVGENSTHKYTRLFPIQRSPQWLFTNKKTNLNSSKKVLVVPGSSGYSQLNIQTWLNTSTSQQQIRAIEIYTRALHLEMGEYIPVWEPISSRLEIIPKLVKLEDSKYNIYVSIFTLRRNWQSTNVQSKLMNTFIELFISEWFNCSNDVKYSINLLSKDEKLMELFNIGAGIN